MNEANGKLQNMLDRLMAGRSNVRLLEAGCGSTSHLRLPSDWHLVGVDISENQLRRNKHLHEKILGDLQTHVWPANSFDIIVCWDVLEHLPEPGKAMDQLLHALKPEGLMVLAMPNLYSIKGLVTKLTPYAFHKWFFRYVIGDKRDMSEFDQFPTFLRPEIAPHRVRRRAQARHADVVYLDVYEGPVQSHLRRHSRLADMAFSLVGAVSRFLSLGRLDLNCTDYIIVLQSRAPETAPLKIATPVLNES
jgi:SAM-dependent methyltransferase